MNRSIAALLCISLLFVAPLRARAALTTDESYVLDQLSSSEALQDSTRLNAESHYAGTPGDYHIATWMRDVLAGAGFHASLETFYHDVPFAKHVELSLLNGPKYKPTKLSLLEAPLAGDPDGSRRDAGVPFNAWSGSGNVIANVVDAGYGTQADYRALAARHVDPRTRILLIRYGRAFRGILAKRAQDHGARGVLFFNDPNDGEGSLNGPAYPDGPYRPNVAIQRGALSEGQIKIPTLPISARNARVFLDDMKNGITEHPAHLVVNMMVKHNAALWNTVGVLPGKDPTHMVVLGAHRDAWVYGVTDNGSGISILLDVARALGNLYKSGWRPQYSIYIVGFDGEEVGELGSEAYVSAHRSALASGCLAYINEDEATTGQRFGAMATAAVEDSVLPVVQYVPDPAPNSSVTLDYRWRHQPGGIRVRGPGGGSDFEPFLYDLGIPVLEYGFGGVFGVYHSAYDDLHYAQTEADPGFANHRAVARLAALTAMRFATGREGYRFAPYIAPMNAAIDAFARQTGAGGLSPVRRAMAHFATAAGTIDARGGDGNREIAIDRSLNELFYGRIGYRPQPFPDIANALASRNRAAISAAIGRTAREIDAITAQLENATTHR